MKTIATFQSTTEAFIAKGRLEIQGIECQLEDTQTFYSLSVLAKYKHAALRILNAAK